MNTLITRYRIRRRAPAALVSVCMLASPLVSAAEIDLQCANSARELVSRLDSAGLLTTGSQMQAQEIARSVCSDAQQSARVQQEAERQDLLSNILFQDTGGKSGNTRLRNLKR
ncbi:MAG: hypothetical protein KDI82_03130 [Gammaproteobacteria bacterium]|nr:hypothetical protein [Gammaproteobacteria bacterium]